MLKELRVKNYVLMDSLDVTFPEGLIIITGQTGAGKSIMLGALSLLMGAKADASVIGDSADNCVVEAEFEMDPDDASLSSLLEENEADWDGGHLLIRRVVNRSGRSRSFINDSPVTVQLLQQLSPSLLDIHSQHQNLLLTDHACQLSMLDHYAGNGSLVAACRKAFADWGSLETELRSLEERIAKIESDRDYDEAQYRQLVSANLKTGELEVLEQEQKTLANAESIKEHLGVAMQIAEGSDGTGHTLVGGLKEISRRLEKLTAFLPQMAGLASRVESSRLDLEDVMAEIEAADASIDASAERLQAVDERLSLLYGLMKKHACDSMEGLIAKRDSLSAGLEGAESLLERKAELEKAVTAARIGLEEAAVALHKARAKAAVPFAESIGQSVHSLELPYAVFSVSLEPAALSASGSDSIKFLFSASGKNPVDVAKCASGGEMSRIMLSLKDMMARYSNMPTMIFDEIDSGVSGSVADSMGSMICRMGEHMQVFAITHLPQVAAKGNAHYLVSKTIDPSSGRSASTIEQLSSDARVMEIARMLSGSALTEAAIANARELLAQ